MSASLMNMPCSDPPQSPSLFGTCINIFAHCLHTYPILRVNIYTTALLCHERLLC